MCCPALAAFIASCIVSNPCPVSLMITGFWTILLLVLVLLVVGAELVVSVEVVGWVVGVEGVVSLHELRNKAKTKRRKKIHFSHFSLPLSFNTKKFVCQEKT